MDNRNYFNDPRMKLVVSLGVILLLLWGFWLISTLWRPASPKETQRPAEPTASQDASGFLPGDAQQGYLPGSTDSATPAPEETDPYDTSGWQIEDTSSVYQRGVYRNNNVVSFAYNDAGETISFGLENGGDSDRLYLNPTASFVTDGRKVGFYISSERAGLMTSTNWSYAPIDDPQNEDHTAFLIRYAYDELTPADSTCLTWANDILYDGKENAGTVLHCRAVDLTGGCRTVAVFTVTIGCNNGVYSIDSIDNADCLATGELDATDYWELLYHAYDSMSNPAFSPKPTATTEFALFGDRGSNAYFSRVEHLGKNTYFNKVYAVTGTILHRVDFMTYNYITDIYAVTLNSSIGHTFTMYYAVTPDAENLYEAFVNRKLEAYTDNDGNINVPEDVIIPDTSPATSKNLVFVGYDIFNPQKRADTGTYFD